MELVEFGEPGHVVRRQHHRPGIPNLGARRNPADRHGQLRIARPLDHRSIEAYGRRLEERIGCRECPWFAVVGTPASERPDVPTPPLVETVVVGVAGTDVQV